MGNATEVKTEGYSDKNFTITFDSLEAKKEPNAVEIEAKKEGVVA